MTTASVENVWIPGIVSALPKFVQNNRSSSFGCSAAEMEKIIASTGIEERRVADSKQTALDLGEAAANTLFKKLNWDKSEVSLVVVVTQTPDFPMPGNAVQLQNKLGLPKSSIAFDVNLGCSGFVYGLWQTAQLLNGLCGKRAVLIVGDTTSRLCKEGDRTVSPLFGDAVSAIAIEKKNESNEMSFSFGTDGAGAPYLIQPNGAARVPASEAELFMDGMQVFAFTLREIPRSIIECQNAMHWDSKQVDFCILHQANKMMLERLGKKLGFNEKQLVVSMSHVGNTSSASIPLALTLSLSSELMTKTNRLLMSGFGIGWSWGSVALAQPKMKVCEVLEV